MNQIVYHKSPLNYIGGKYKLLPQLMKFFPQKIHTMVDLFAGGCDVCSNIKAEKIYANDNNPYVIGIYQAFQKISIQELLTYLEETIEKNHLSLTNKEAYYLFRRAYNETAGRNPLDLYILVCYAFNHQFRFNSRHEFNSPFGQNRSCFNPAMRANLTEFHRRVQTIEFSAVDFKDFDLSSLKEGDFLYADPPYLITTGSYNDGKRGFEGWSEEDDRALFNLLDQLDKQGVKFAFSNVSEHKGAKNKALMAWKKKYHTHKIHYDYKNSSYHAKNTDKPTREILITNY